MKKHLQSRRNLGSGCYHNPRKEILHHAYEYVLREDILLSLEYNDLTDDEARALLKSEDILSDVFKDWEKKETEHMVDIWETVKKPGKHFKGKTEEG